jgi:hypothetical protein
LLAQIERQPPRRAGSRPIFQPRRPSRGKAIAPLDIEVTDAIGAMVSVRAGIDIRLAFSQAMRHENHSPVSRRIKPVDGLHRQLNIIAPEAKMRSRASRPQLGPLIANERDSAP